jgi:hypothetical protein
MARNENPPFDMGNTFYNLFVATTQSTNDGVQYEGADWVFEDYNPITKVYRSEQKKRCRLVRNISGGALLPSRLVNLATAPNANGIYGGQVDGYASVLAQRAYPLDEFLPAAGLQNNDIGYVVVEGPAVVLTDLAALTAVINPGDAVVAQTAATSGATTAGRVEKQDLTGATAALGNMIMNYVGRAMSAATTANTGAALLVYVGHM